MRLLHSLARTHASFDDPNLVSRAGLVPVMALAQRAGLADLAEAFRRDFDAPIDVHLYGTPAVFNRFFMQPGEMAVHCYGGIHV